MLLKKAFFHKKVEKNIKKFLNFAMKTCIKKFELKLHEKGIFFCGGTKRLAKSLVTASYQLVAA